MGKKVAVVTMYPELYKRYEKSFRLASRVQGYEQADVKILDANKLFTVQQPNKNHFAQVRDKVYKRLSKFDVTLLVDHTALRICVSACKGSKKNDQDSPYEPWYGKVLRHKVGGWMVVLPDIREIASLMEQGQKWLKTLFIEQMDRALMNPASCVMHSDVCGGREEPILRVAKTTESVIKVLKKVLKAEGRIAADIETDDLDPYDFADNILGIQFSTDGKTGVYCVYEKFNDAAKELLDEILRNKLLIFHNGAFDTKYLKLRGHAMARHWVDTMLLAHMFDERIEKSLKAWTWFLTDQGGYDDELDLYKHENKIKKYGEIPMSILGPYGAMDPVVTWRIWHALSTRTQHYHPVKLPTAPAFNLFKKSTMPLRKALTDIELTGFYVNRKAAKDIKDWCEDLKPRLSEVVQKDLGVINLRSPKQLQEALFGTTGLGLEPTKFTRTKAPSCDAEALEDLHKLNPGIEGLDALMDLKYIQNVTGKFIDNFLKFSAYDGRMHGQYGITNTVSGRLGMTNPNLQNTPRDLLIRNLLCAPPGRTLVEADLKSAEYAALAAETQDPYLLMVFATGQDLHNAMFRIVKDKPDDYVPDSDERLWVKTITYGIVYGRGAPSLAQLLGCSTKEAQDAINLYMHKMPKVEAYIKRTHAAAKKYGYLSNGFGRIRRLYPKVFSDGYGQRRCLRQSVNFKCQSGSADYTNLGLVGVHRDIREIDRLTKIVHTVHDCVIVETDPPLVDQVKEVIEANFSVNRKELPTNMRADAEQCQAWGEGNVSRLQDIFSKYA